MIDASEFQGSKDLLTKEPDFCIKLHTSESSLSFCELLMVAATNERLIQTKTGIAYAWIEGAQECAIRVNYQAMQVELVSASGLLFGFEGSNALTRLVMVPGARPERKLQLLYRISGEFGGMEV